MSKHQRITETLERYWDSIKAENALPSEADVDPAELEAIWDDCFLVRSEGGDRFHYLYMGPGIVEAMGDDLTGKEVCDKLVGGLHDPLASKFLRALQADAPRQEESSFTNRHKMEIKYRMCLLPLCDREKQTVRYILGGMKWRAY